MKKPTTLYESVPAFIAWQREDMGFPTNQVLNSQAAVERFLHWLTVEDSDDIGLVDDLRIKAYLRYARRTYGLSTRQAQSSGRALEQWRFFLTDFLSPKERATGRVSKLKKKSSGVPRHFSDTELDAILTADDRRTDPSYLMVTAAIRLMHDHLLGSEEQRTLTMKCLDLKNGELFHRAEIIKLTAETRTALVRYLEHGRPSLLAKFRRHQRKGTEVKLLFIGQHGNLIHKNWLSDNLQSRANAAGVAKEANSTVFLRSAKARQGKS